jgi:hypothetical protein
MQYRYHVVDTKLNNWADPSPAIAHRLNSRPKALAGKHPGPGKSGENMKNHWRHRHLNHVIRHGPEKLE